MPTEYTPPDPAELALLLQGAQFQHPTQQPIFATYAAGDIGIETTIFLLVQEAQQRAPLETAKRVADATLKAELTRIEAEMTANETADAPTFISVILADKPVAKEATAIPVVKPIVSATSGSNLQETAESEAPTHLKTDSYGDKNTLKTDRNT